MTVPTQGEVFARMIERCKLIQEDMATLAHLTRSMSNSSKDRALADGWIACSELMKRQIYQYTKLAQGKLQ